eukprot:TRINITY_DN20892_c0_g1_i1.p2 TRINITY_DN20892_c0_g1~~TRINITY_DN20892_c0_g1_i1.p2  ORF type:complete len:186 (-),score=59.77 TRINITY_DN20892_c0_g1_i1:164-721(-)
MASFGSRKIFITGPPGIGKSTCIRKLYDLLKEHHPCGFWTQEIRHGSTRQGFEVVSFSSGKRATLAHVDSDSPKRVSKYGVDVKSFEAVALPELSPPPGRLLLLDEIGKMECFSTQFMDAVRKLLTDDSLVVVGTIAEMGPAFVKEVKSTVGVQIVEINYKNRNDIPQQLAHHVVKLLGVAPASK